MNYYNFSEEELKNEEWRDCFGWEELYKVSTLGRVMRKDSGKILKPGTDGHGYLKVQLSKNGFTKQVLVHRLVAQTHIGPCPVGHEVDHWDHDRTNNRKDNLQYLTRKENLDRRVYSGLDKRNRIICQYSKDYKLIGKFPSLTLAGESLNRNNTHSAISTVYKACTGINKSAYGYYWSFEGESTGAEKKAFKKQLKELSNQN